MPTKLRSIAMGVAAAGAVGALIWVAVRPETVPVDLATVTTGAMEVTINGDGVTRIRNIYEVAAPVAGKALRSPVEVGDTVVAGKTIVARVEPVDPGLLDRRSRNQAEAAVKEAEAAVSLALTQIAKAEADVDYARSQYDRAEALSNRGVFSLTQLEDAAQLLKVQEAALAAARAQHQLSIGALERARAALIGPESDGMTGTCCVEIAAPADGAVLSLANASERPVIPGTVLLSVGQPRDLEIVVDLLSSDAVRVEAGARAEILRWGGEGALAATVREVEPAGFTKVSALGIEEQRVNVILDLESPVEMRAGLGDGFSVFARIVEWSTDAALLVPIGALFRANGGWAVFTAQDGHAALTQVRVGHMNDTVAEVLEGLQEGVQVITHPSDRIEDGTGITDRQSLE
ncbi:HlyD family efflux transporter periplasmic adaptor subunit [Defluviimonas sp. WL0002]|uniref:HlyD family efflux transporter periplasmic adaptor subunit n=1 Tax=Albidovulum marisflavi TaxID=2984159 RepID=A0ABT2ZDG5_9RHOB|nr:HlyD family efflux transporter periplasmic adaptor subunit [Defluviimonas sp. WL0002]MCV2869180.1 HlyD family efflux transporter periplasmic adaptor subunit [Defluviimonas sp. WL0002]